MNPGEVAKISSWDPSSTAELVEAVRAEMREITGDEHDDDRAPEPFEAPRRDARDRDRKCRGAAPS